MGDAVDGHFRERHVADGGGGDRAVHAEIVVIGGGVTGALGESFTERIWDIAQRYTLPGATANVKFAVAALGDDSGIVGAAAYARSKVEVRP